jgi:hypothetical protein
MPSEGRQRRRHFKNECTWSEKLISQIGKIFYQDFFKGQPLQFCSKESAITWGFHKSSFGSKVLVAARRVEKSVTAFRKH